MIKQHGGKYRKARDAPPCWYVAPSAIEGLNNALRGMPATGEIQRLVVALWPFLSTSDTAEAVPASTAQVQSEEPPRKRLRITENRRKRSECRACVYEVEALERGDGFGQMYHTCHSEHEE